MISETLLNVYLLFFADLQTCLKILRIYGLERLRPTPHLHFFTLWDAIQVFKSMSHVVPFPSPQGTPNFSTKAAVFRLRQIAELDAVTCMFQSVMHP